MSGKPDTDVDWADMTRRVRAMLRAEQGHCRWLKDRRAWALRHRMPGLAQQIDGFIENSEQAIENHIAWLEEARGLTEAQDLSYNGGEVQT